MGRNVLIAVISFIVGAAAVFAAAKTRPNWFVPKAANSAPVVVDNPVDDIANRERNIFERFNKQFNDDFFRPPESPQDLREFREDMSTGLAPAERQDKDYVYYDINVDDPKATTVDAKVDNGYVTITGKEDKKSDNGEYQSTFQRVFPVPAQVDASKMQTTSEAGKIVLKFPKLKS